MYYTDTLYYTLFVPVFPTRRRLAFSRARPCTFTLFLIRPHRRMSGRVRLVHASHPRIVTLFTMSASE